MEWFCECDLIEDVEDEKKHEGPSTFLYSLSSWLTPFWKSLLTTSFSL